MAVKPNATFTFQSYTVQDLGIEMIFLCADPGPGQPSHYTIVLTDSELAAVTTQPQLTTLVKSKLDRKVRAVNIASKLDPFIGQSLVV